MKIQDLIDDGEYDLNPLYCFNIRGTNGSGKSSVIRAFMGEEYEYLTVPSIKKPAFTYVRDFNLLIIGNYLNTCGGCDNLVKAQIVQLLKIAWMTTCNILFEGVLVSDSKEPYMWLMKDLNDTLKVRNWGFVYLDTPLDTCLSRISQRNGGKEFNTLGVAAKHSNMIRYSQWQDQFDFCKVIHTDATKTSYVVAEDIHRRIQEYKLKIGSNR